MSMINKLKKLLYRCGLLRSASRIDRNRYLHRLQSGATDDSGQYFSRKDRDQYRAERAVLIRSVFREHGFYMACKGDNHVEQSILRHGIYAPFLLDIIADFIGSGAVVDVGANVGALAIPLARAFPNNKVFAFEPNPAAVARLRRNCALNNLTNLEIREEGVGHKSGNLELHAFDNKDLGQSSFIPPQTHTETPHTIVVPVIRLDDVFALISVSVIKIDVQGAEWMVLEGARKLLNESHPLVLLEHEDSNFPDAEQAKEAKYRLRNLFQESGYQIFTSPSKTPT